MEFQLELFKAMGQNNESNFIKYNLAQLNNYGGIFKKLVSAWREGDTNTLNQVAIKEMQKTDPNSYKLLISDRNNNWLPKVEAMFGNDKSEFILVGVAHLAGQDSLLTLLENRGYTVSLLEVDNVVAATTKEAE